jgi:hypothetical protein
MKKVDEAISQIAAESAYLGPHSNNTAYPNAAASYQMLRARSRSGCPCFGFHDPCKFEERTELSLVAYESPIGSTATGVITFGCA